MKDIFKNKKTVSTIVAVIVMLAFFFTRSDTEQQELVDSWVENIATELTADVSAELDESDEKVTDEISEVEVIPPSEGEVREVTLDRVVDGDTLVVNEGNKSLRIRLIGIDTPESVSPKKEKNTIYGEYASDYVKALLEEGETLYLEYDVEPTDSFDRELAYVWLDSDFENLENMLNFKIVYDGYGINKEYPPNLKYAEKLETARADAILEIRGLWKYDEYHELVD
jgi:micrococcal nuclease